MKKNTLRFQISLNIFVTFLIIALLYSLILFPLESRRRANLLNKIEFSIDAIFEQRQKSIANEMFLNHQKAVELLIAQFLEIDGIIAVGIYDLEGNLFSGTHPSLKAISRHERKRIPETYSFEIRTWEAQEVGIYTKPIIVIEEVLGYAKIYYSMEEVSQETEFALIIFSTLLVTIFVAMALMLNRFLSKSVIHPVGLIVQAMGKLREGSLDQQVQMKVNNEIGEMGHTFNTMSAEKAKMYQELEDLNRHLESKVSERTRELETAKTEAERAKQKAESANHAKSEFLSHMSHELRTPLNGILGYTQILKREKHLSEFQQDSLDIIHQSGSHLLTLINDILDLSTIEARRLELNPTEFRFAPFLEAIVSIIRMRAWEKNISFEYLADTSMPIGIVADEIRLRQVLLNLLGNAVKFTAKNGNVTFSVEAINDLNDPGSLPGGAGVEKKWFRFKIKDNGIGIEPEAIDKIFLPFERVGGDSLRSTGTGLGLPISKSLVEKMGSEIKVQSSKEQGTVFWFDLILPTVEIKKDTYPTTRRNISGYVGQKKSLLIVDDDKSNRFMLTKLLVPIGFECIDTGFGEEGLELASDNKPDLIVVGLNLPDMSGISFVKQIRSKQPVSDTKIFIISASASQTTKDQCLNSGCDAFLEKPFEMEILFERIKSHLGVEWIFEDSANKGRSTIQYSSFETTTLFKKSDLPPKAELNNLYELAQRGDMRRIQEKTAELKKDEVPYKRFVEILHMLAKDFRDKEILQLVETQVIK